MYISSMMLRFLVYILIVLVNTSISFAEIVNDINVKGNNRVSADTIIVFSDIKKGDNVTNKILNKSLKELYGTNFFKDVKITLENQLLTITVEEYPIIQQIQINGIKRSKTVEDIKSNISLKEKNPFNKSLIKNDLNQILNIFKQNGFYFVEVDVKIEKNQNNTVNIIYDVDRGEKATINKIKFIGDKKFKDRKLNSIITSEENKFWKFISKGKYLNIDRVELDKRLLKNFYLNKGYYNVEITDAYSSIIDKENFILTFNINAGEKFNFGKFKLVLPTDFDRKKFSKLDKLFNNLENTKYNINQIENILDEIDKIALLENYEFINAKVLETIDENNVNFEFQVIETENVYLSKVDIFGNHITSEKFIRNNLLVDEGDPLNELLNNKSINNLRATGLFQSVESKILDTDDKDKKNMEIMIEEKATGEITAAAGVGTDGSSFSLGIKENNFNGEGIILETNLSLSESSVRGLVSYSHPNFAYSDRALNTSIESTVEDNLTDFGYKSTMNRISLGTGYEQFDDLFFSPRISISSESIDTNSNASASLKKQDGSYFDTLFSYGLNYDKRNSRFQPTDGYISNWIQEIPIISDHASIINGYTFTKYSELADNLILSTGFYGRAVNSLSDDDVRISKRLHVPSRRLRGFTTGKVGPKDGNDYVGGNYVATFNASSTVPYIFQTFENTDLKVFFDAGNVWGVDYSSSIDDSNKLRSSSGIALEIFSPVGPLSFSYAEAITKASTDKTESFRFQLGTTF